MWAPVLPIYAVLALVLSLLDQPVLDDPLVPETAQTFVGNYDRYFENARQYTRKYATGERPDISELLQ
jgi:ubiquitin-protein ligase